MRETSRPLCARQMWSPGGEIIIHMDFFSSFNDDYLLASLNVPEDTRHVAAGGEDLIVVQEPEHHQLRIQVKSIFRLFVVKNCDRPTQHLKIIKFYQVPQFH